MGLIARSEISGFYAPTSHHEEYEGHEEHEEVQEKSTLLELWRFTGSRCPTYVTLSFTGRLLLSLAERRGQLSHLPFFVFFVTFVLFVMRSNF